MTLDDFMTGLLVGLAEHGVHAVSLRGNTFAQAAVQAFQALEELPGDERPDLRFWITTHPVYGDSADVRAALTRALLRGLASMDSPEYETLRIRVTEPESVGYLDRLPGGSQAHRHAVDAFLKCYGHC